MNTTMSAEMSPSPRTMCGATLWTSENLRDQQIIRCTLMVGHAERGTPHADGYGFAWECKGGDDD